MPAALPMFRIQNRDVDTNGRRVRCMSEPEIGDVKARVIGAVQCRGRSQRRWCRGGKIKGKWVGQQAAKNGGPTIVLRYV